jgi:pyruvate dehydrogenase E2 component (dihydrolipoamide acetyltransferase)
MATYIEMPKLSDTMTEGTLVKWRKKVGDAVEVGDILAEVETDKATMEMEAFDDGILHQTLVKEGEKVPIGTHIGLLLAKGETPPKDGPAPAAKPATTPAASGKKAGSEQTPSKREEKSAVARTESPAARTRSGAPSPVPAESHGRIRISPLARKMAVERGIDVATLAGSGPGGRIVAHDVEHAGAPGSRAHTRDVQGTPSAAAAPIPSLPLGEGDERIALSGMRRIIAERLLTSKTTIPHFYLFVEVDAAPLVQLRAEANAMAEGAEGTKLTINDFVLKAVVAAVARVPSVNASFAGDAVVRYRAVNLAIAVAVEEGLVTPVIREAQRKSLRELSALVKDLATRARAKKLKPEEYQGGTITVTNLGSYGIDSFSAIINPPQAVIVSVGAIVKKPVVGPDDKIVVGQRMTIGLSADHRVVDGAIGAQYIAEVRRLIEAPALMLL